MSKQRKMIVVGVDGMDARLAKKFLDAGKMPNLKKLLEHGSAREDLVMLGGVPTITPPMWTTLATGATPGTHGITDFWNQHPTELDTLVYSLDSRNCKAEQLWNVTAEAGRNTLVWHWPGSSWPPTSDSPNLSVVEGTTPSDINFVDGVMEFDKFIWAKESFTDAAEYKMEEEDHSSGAGCIISGVDLAEVDDDAPKQGNAMDTLGSNTLHAIMLSEYEGENSNADKFETRDREIAEKVKLSPCNNWKKEFPAGAKEFTIPVSNGLERRLGVIYPNENGIYDKVEIYKNKRSEEPLAVVQGREIIPPTPDTVLKKEERIDVTKTYMIIDLPEDGSEVFLYVGRAMKADLPDLFHPKSLYREIFDNVGPAPGVILSTSTMPEDWFVAAGKSWDFYAKWQADCINYLIEKHQYEIVFSHLHNVDCIGHCMWERAAKREEYPNSVPEEFQAVMEYAYVQTDNYIGEFMHLLDDDWTIIVTSDHGLVCAREDMPPALGDPFGVNTKAMVEMGYTVLKKDENGEPLREIDWEKTTAVAPRGLYIYINLKGRNPHGIVDPADKYELEEKIITDLYNYRYNGKRCVALALRKQDAALLGLGTQEDDSSVGDIVYWLSEGFNRVHGDSLSTYMGLADTSESPIFAIGGSGVKKGFYTDRIIREVDIAPTMAILAGVRIPAQCEGAPVYQIFDLES
ncbi:MAG: alkaline phosphatase family protein [Peptococcaceae bacterium]|nr:alkaline phosphatase family protein [Peptococcaceae bacterium]